MADYTDFDFAFFSDLELVVLSKESRDLGDMEFVRAVMIELGRRERERNRAE